MKLSDLVFRFASAYVDEHEAEIAEAIIDALDVDLDEVASQVAEAMGDITEKVAEEVLERM